MRKLVNSFFLVICFFLIFCGSGHNLEFSRKYIPIYNPGGEYFFNDQKFLKSYELYEKRRNVFKENATIKPNNTSKVVPKNKPANKSEPTESGGLAEASAFIDNDGAMINNYGIDIARLKGAKFIQIMDYYQYDQKKEKQKSSFAVFSQRIKDEFEKVSHGIALKMKNVSKKKSRNFNNQDSVVNFNNYDNVEQNQVKCYCANDLSNSEGKSIGSNSVECKCDTALSNIDEKSEEKSTDSSSIEHDNALSNIEEKSDIEESVDSSNIENESFED